MLVQDYPDAPILLLLLKKLREFICTIDLSRESWLLYATIHQLMHFLDRYRNVLLTDNFDKVRDRVGLISKSIKEHYPDISEKLDLFIKQSQ